MSQRWLKFLEKLGAPTGPASPSLPFDPASIRHGAWYEFRDFEALFRLYGPHPDSPWYPYHCPTLFAAIERGLISPRPIQIADEVATPQPDGAWQWLGPGTMVVIDLAGGLSVQLGARLLCEAGVQLISTFDHWPCARPQSASTPSRADLQRLAPRSWPPGDVLRSVAIDSRDVIDSMVSMAPQIFERMKHGIAFEAPPVWMCDSRRTVALAPGPGDFDNRYYIDDSLLPSGELLRARGIERLAYVSYRPGARPADDLCGFIDEWHRSGIALSNVALVEPATWCAPLPMQPPPLVKLAGRKFPKSQVGGFGVEIPVPTQGSYSGASG